MFVRWIIEYFPLINVKIKRKINKTNDSWRVDEIYVKVNIKMGHLYKGVDSNENKIDFMLKVKEKLVIKSSF